MKNKGCSNQIVKRFRSLKIKTGTSRFIKIKSELKNFENKYNQENHLLKDEIEEKTKEIVTLQTELKDRILEVEKETMLVKILKLSLRNTVTK